jgi:hypothetical protein
MSCRPVIVDSFRRFFQRLDLFERFPRTASAVPLSGDTFSIDAIDYRTKHCAERPELSKGEKMTCKRIAVVLIAVICALPAIAASKLKGTTSLKDFQPAGTTDKKHKHQQFDFTFDATGTQYTCRSPEGTKLNATDFPVGGNITYQIDKDKGSVKNASGKEVKCTVMRVEKLPDTSTPTPSPQ